MTRVPEFISHYSRGVPFRSITSLPEGKRLEVIRELNETNAWGLNRFADSEYVTRRLEVERQIHEEFISQGGKQERNRAYLIYLQDLPADVVSFTYGDSLLAFNKSYRFRSGEKYQSELCAKVFRRDELEALISQLPQNEPLSIEAQLWMEPPKEIVKQLRSEMAPDFLVQI